MSAVTRTLDLPPALDGRLRLIAAKAGVTPEALILDLLDDMLADIVPRPSIAAIRIAERQNRGAAA